jgi:hypothetical protein
MKGFYKTIIIVSIKKNHRLTFIALNDHHFMIVVDTIKNGGKIRLNFLNRNWFHNEFFYQIKFENNLINIVV